MDSVPAAAGREEQRGLPPGEILPPPSAISSSEKKSSCFKMLHTIISRKHYEHTEFIAQLRLDSRIAGYIIKVQ